MSLIDELQNHVRIEQELINQAALEGDEDRREELLARADEESKAYLETLQEILAVDDSDKQNNCVFCGMPVAVEDVHIGFSGQFGNIDCETCGTAYQIRVTVENE